ncbi:hypothetical protein INO88_15380 [Staphylococcus aureus]|nr:hypothetical protein [Staphylococcus aureus]
MASSLGNAFGVAVSGTVYTVLAANLNLNLGGFTKFPLKSLHNNLLSFQFYKFV